LGVHLKPLQLVMAFLL